MSTPQYEVVSPLGDERDARDGGTRQSSAAPLAGLEGKRIGLVWTAFTNGDLVLRSLQAHLAKRFNSIEFVDVMPGRGLRWGDHPEPNITDLAREARIDAAIVTAGC
jgi:hypothetical protein